MINKKLFVLGNGTDWCKQSLCRLREYDFVRFNNNRIPINNKLLHLLARVHFSFKLNNIVKLPFKSLWYKVICKSIGLEDNSILLIYDRNIFGADENFLKYIRKTYKKIKIAYIFTNVCEFTLANELNYLNCLNFWYDVVFAFDPNDAVKYNFAYSPLIYDSDNIKKTQKYNDKVFFIGKAKDRLPMIHSCYKKLKEISITTDFHVVDVDPNMKKYSNEIEYNKYLTYQDCISSIQDASCILDVVQGNSIGLTIKVCEAINFNKKLITTNQHIMNYSFYDPRLILVIKTSDDINKEFFRNNSEVKFTEEARNYFSADNFLDRLIKELY